MADCQGPLGFIIPERRYGQLGEKLERETGFEPATLALARRCSTTELFPLPARTKPILLAAPFPVKEAQGPRPGSAASLAALSATWVPVAAPASLDVAGHPILCFKRLKETGPQSLRDFAPLYYGFMSEFHDLLFT